MKLMKYDHIPRRYHLLWNSSQKAVVIQIHKDCLSFVKPVPKDSHWVRNLSKKHEIDGLPIHFQGIFHVVHLVSTKQ